MTRSHWPLDSHRGIARRGALLNGPPPPLIPVFLEDGYVRVMWRERGLRRYQGWPDSKPNRQEAKAFAQGLSDTLGRPKETPVFTLRQIWDRYREPEFPHLRPSSQRLYTARWAKWELFMKGTFPADDVTLEHVDQFRLALTKQGVASNQVREIIKVAKVVHNWAESRELISRNRLGKYRFTQAKGELVHAPDEYTVLERDRLIAAFNPRLGTEWRPWVLLMIIGNHGVRASAALHLRWEDIDEASGEVVWRADYDKLGHEWRQALTWPMVSALQWARWWRERQGYAGPWILFSLDKRSGKRKNGQAEKGVYRVQSFWTALTKAEKRVGIEDQPFRAAHGLRRMVAGEVLARTKDPVLAMHYIGDTDMKTMKRYLKRRDDRLRAIAELWTLG